VDRSKGGFWSLTMYDQDYFMLPASPNGRDNIGTVNVDADELQFGTDGSLTLHLSHKQPAGKDEANWLPAPEGQFELIVRAYVPTQLILDGRTPPMLQARNRGRWSKFEGDQLFRERENGENRRLECKFAGSRAPA
jgi:hypothetical protein